MAGKVVKQLAGSGTGQSLKDRVNAAKYSISGSGLAKTVCKATTEEIAAPKRKHVEYLLMCTHEPNISIPELADQLITRCHNGSWVVSFKAFITLHTLMNSGNERLSQYLASNNCELAMRGFTDKNTVQGYDMSLFVRKYSCYINEKADAYREMAFDFCKVKRGKDGVLRTMPGDKLLKSLPVLQRQLDSLLEFEASHSDLNNPVINNAFLLLYKDLIRLFASYNEAMINLFDKYFNMNKKQCKEGLQLYKNYIQRTDKVNSFLKTAEGMGFGESDVFALQPVTSTLLESLEAHLAYLEGNKNAKPGNGAAMVQGQTGARDTPTNSGAIDIGSVLQDVGRISEAERRKIIEEESQRLAQFATARLSNSGASSSTLASGSASQPSQRNRPSEDLLALHDDFPSSSSSAWTTADFGTSSSPFMSTNTAAFNPFQPTPSNSSFLQPTPLQPSPNSGHTHTLATSQHSMDLFSVKQPAIAPTAATSTMSATTSSTSKPLGSGANLDDTLASLAGSLTLSGPAWTSKWTTPPTASGAAMVTGPSPRTTNTGVTSINWGGGSTNGGMGTQMAGAGVGMGGSPAFWQPPTVGPNSVWTTAPAAMMPPPVWPATGVSHHPMFPGPQQTSWAGIPQASSNNPFAGARFPAPSGPTDGSSNAFTSSVNDPFGAM